MAGDLRFSNSELSDTSQCDDVVSSTGSVLFAFVRGYHDRSSRSSIVRHRSYSWGRIVVSAIKEEVLQVCRYQPGSRLL